MAGGKSAVKVAVARLGLSEKLSATITPIFLYD
jgi:hypothetical protein